MTDHLTQAEIEALRRGESLAGGRDLHAEDCPRCQARLQGFERTWDALGSIVPESDRDLWPSIAVELEEADRSRRLPWLKGLAVAAALALVASLWSVARLGWTGGMPTERRAAAAEYLDLERPAASRLALVIEVMKQEQEGEGWTSLMAVLESDPDEHVRIAALDLAARAILEGSVPRLRLLSILSAEPSPVVQSDLVDLLLQAGGGDILPSLRDALPVESTHPFVLAQLAAQT